MKKICTVCKKEKPITGFYKDKRGRMGRYAACRQCHNSVIMSYKKPRYRNIRRAAMNRYMQKETTPLKTKARSLANKALNEGKIFAEKCSFCAEKVVELHHPDYSKPLDVVVVCKQHHADLHYSHL